MMYCKVCGLPTDARCCEPASVRCIPAHMPVSGYITLDQLSSLADDVDPQPSLSAPEEEAPIGPRFSMFSLSMGLVKWLGVTVICLLIIFFLTVFLKAFT